MFGLFGKKSLFHATKLSETDTVLDQLEFQKVKVGGGGLMR